MFPDYQSPESGLEFFPPAGFRKTILVAPDGFSFMVWEMNQARPVYFKSFPFDNPPGTWHLTAKFIELKKALDPVFQKDFPNPILVPFTTAARFLPRGIEKPEWVDSLFHLGQKVDQNQKLIQAGVYDEAECWLSLPEEFIENLRNLLPGLIVIHPFISLTSLIQPKALQQLIVFQDDHHIWISAFRHSKAELFTVFSAKATTDSMYHILNTIQSLEFQPEKLTLCLAGTSRRLDELQTKLGEYIPDIQAPSEHAGSAIQNPYPGLGDGSILFHQLTAQCALFREPMEGG